MVLTEKHSYQMEQNCGINLSTYNFSHLMFDKDSKNVSWRIEKKSSTNDAGKTKC